MSFPGPTLAATDSDSRTDRLLTDFTPEGRDLGWFVVNDNVMGGRSEGDFEQAQGKLRFVGRTNTNGGGFSSIRTKPLQLDLSRYAGIRLHVLGDGRRYTWRLATAARWRGQQVSYWADFETFDGEWSTADIPFTNFVPKFRGNELDGPALDPREITGMGLMIYDNQDGPFELQLASIHALAQDAAFSLSRYQWKKRVLVLSASTDSDEQLQRQLEDVALTAEEFADRDMVLVTILDDAVSTADGQALAAGEDASIRSSLDIEPGSFALRLIGKDGAVKMSGAAVVPMTEIYGLIDSMPMRQREKRGNRYGAE